MVPKNPWYVILTISSSILAIPSRASLASPHAYRLAARWLASDFGWHAQVNDVVPVVGVVAIAAILAQVVV